MKNPLAIVALPGIGIGVLAFAFPRTRRVFLSIILLLCLGVLWSYAREKRPIRNWLVMGLLIIPLVTAGFFFRFTADLVFCSVLLFFGSILALSMFQVVSERQKLCAAYFTFIGALAAATALNYRTILQLFSGG